MAITRKVDAPGIPVSHATGLRSGAWLTDSQQLGWDALWALFRDSATESPFLVIQGPEGVGKTWLLRQFFDAVRQKQDDRSPAVKNGRRRPDDASQSPTVAVAHVDFCLPPGDMDDVRLPLWGLLCMRRELAVLSPIFPLFDLGILIYFYKTGQVVPTRLAHHFPRESRRWIYHLADALLKTWPEIDARMLLAPESEHAFVQLPADETSWFARTRQVIDALRHAHPENDLLEQLPDLLFEDSRLLLRQSGHQRVLFCFDHADLVLHAAGRTEAGVGDPLTWFRALLNKLPSGAEFRTVVMLRNPERLQGMHMVRSARMVHLEMPSRKEARQLVESLGISDPEIKTTLIHAGRHQELRYSPLRLATAHAIYRLMDNQGLTFVADERTSTSADRGLLALVRQLLIGLDRDAAQALVALAAPRYFDAELYTYLSRFLVFNANHQAFQQIVGLPFVHATVRNGRTVYRLHDEFRFCLLSIGRSVVDRAYQALYQYYSDRERQGHNAAALEAIIALNRLAPAASFRVWQSRLASALEEERYQTARSLIGILPFMEIHDRLLQPRILRALAGYYRAVGLMARAEFCLHQALSTVENLSPQTESQTQLVAGERLRVLLQMAYFDYGRQRVDRAERLLTMIFAAREQTLTGEPLDVPMACLVAQAYLLLFRILTSKQHSEQAEEALQRCEILLQRLLEAAPGSEPAQRLRWQYLHLRAEWLLSLGRFAEAEDLLDRCTSSLLRQVELETAGACLAVAGLQRLFGRYWKEAGDLHRSMQRFAAAEQWADRALGKQPGLPQGWHMRLRVGCHAAAVSLWAGDHESAQQYAETVCALAEHRRRVRPDDGLTQALHAHALLLQGLACEQRGDKEKAYAYVQRAAEVYRATLSDSQLSAARLKQGLQIAVTAGLTSGFDRNGELLFAAIRGLVDNARRRNGKSDNARQLGHLAAWLQFAALLLPPLKDPLQAAAPGGHSTVDTDDERPVDWRVASEEFTVQALVELHKAEQDMLEGRSQQALHCTGRLLERVRPRHEQFPANPLYRFIIARSWDLESRMAFQQGRIVEALETALRTHDLLDSLQKSHPGWACFRDAFLRQALELAGMYECTGEVTHAEKLLKACEHLVQRHRQGGEIEGWGLETLGLIAMHRGRRSEAAGDRRAAAQHYALAVDCFQQATEAESQNRICQVNALLARLSLLITQQEENSCEEAMKLVEALERMARDLAGSEEGLPVLYSTLQALDALNPWLLHAADAAEACRFVQERLINIADLVRRAEAPALDQLYRYVEKRWCQRIPELRRPSARSRQDRNSDAPIDAMLDAQDDTHALLRAARLLQEQALLHLGAGKIMQAQEALVAAVQRYDRLFDLGIRGWQVVFLRAVCYAHLAFCHAQDNLLEDALPAFEKAMQAFHSLLERTPDHPQVAHWLGDLYLSLGMLFRNSDNLERTESLLQQAVEYYERLAGQPTVAQGEGGASGSVFANLGRAHLELSTCYHHAQDFARALWHGKKAVEVLQRACTEDLETLANQRRLAEGFVELGDLQMALSQYRDADDSYYHAAQVYQHLLKKQPQDVEICYGCATAHGHLGRVKYLLGQPQAAVQEYRRAVDYYAMVVQLQEDHRHARLNLGLCKATLGKIFMERKNWEEAKTCFNEAVTQFDRCIGGNESRFAIIREKAGSLLQLGRCHHESAFYDSARSCYEKAIALYDEILSSSDDDTAVAGAAEAHYFLACLFRQQNREKEMRLVLDAGSEKLAALSQRYPERLDVLVQHGLFEFRFAEMLDGDGVQTERHGRYRAAFEALYSAFKLNPNEPQIRLLLQEIRGRAEQLGVDLHGRASTREKK